jgi:hypothetical protein
VAIRGFAHHLHPLGLEKDPERLANDLVIVGEQDFYGHCSLGSAEGDPSISDRR